jgi:hypothetical protein
VALDAVKKQPLRIPWIWGLTVRATVPFQANTKRAQRHRRRVERRRATNALDGS